MKATSKKNLKITFVVWLFLFLFSSIKAEQLPVQMFTSADGLGSGFVNYIYRDSRGFMWFCTRDGLSRFDGSKFVNYQIGEKNAPPGIEGIFERSDGTYFIVTTGGTYRFNPKVMSAQYSATPHLKAERISNIRGLFFEDSKGNLWMISGGIYLVVEENDKIEFRKTDWGIPAKSLDFEISQISETPDGALWVSTTWGLVRRLPDERIVVYSNDRPSFDGTGSYWMATDKKSGRIWISLLNELYVINPEPLDLLKDAGKLTIKTLEASKTFEIKPEEGVPMPEDAGEIFQYTNPIYISKFTSRRILQTSDGNIWVSVADALLQFDGNELNVFTPLEGLPNGMGFMAEDAQGNLWIGGYTGLARLNRNGMRTYGLSEGAYSSQFSAITEATDGALYFANADSHIIKLNGARLQSARPGTAPNSANTWASRFMFVDSSGDFWILTSGKLYRFSGVKNFAELQGKEPTKTYTSADGLKSDIMFQIFEDSKGNIWVSTRGTSSDFHGLSRLKKSEDKFQSFSESQGFPSKTSVMSFAEDKNGNIWLGFYEGGLARFDGEKFEVLSDEKDFQPKGVISDLLIDKQGRLWLSTSNSGLFRIDDTTAKIPTYNQITTENGLTSNNIRTITQDNFGRIYIGTARGVDRITPETGLLKHYSVNDGLGADFVFDSHCDKSGNLWFATSNGVSRLVPQHEEKISPPQIFIGGLRIAGEQQAISELGNVEVEKGELSASQNDLQIDFFGLDFRAGETLRYQYKFDGAGTDWSVPTDQRQVNFANLSAGNYRFLVRAINSENIASANPAVVSFKILSPIYLRWWFITLCVLVLGSIIFSFFRYRISNLQAINAALEETKRAKEERLAELEKVRSRIATDLHDDIGASLTQIAILSEVAQAESKGNGASKPLEMIYSVSNELVGTMSDIVWAINPKKDHLRDLTLRMRRFASDVLTAKEIDFEFDAPQDESRMSLSSNLRREVFLIFKEAVNNIVKHSQATQVKIDFEISAKDLLLTVKDNGKGFELDKFVINSSSNLFADYSGGNGLPSIKKRTAELDGEIEILSEINRGTSINLRLPLQNMEEKTKN